MLSTLMLVYSAARQLFVYTENSSRKYYVNHNTMAWVNAKLGHTFNCTWLLIRGGTAQVVQLRKNNTTPHDKLYNGTLSIASYCTTRVVPPLVTD